MLGYEMLTSKLQDRLRAAGGRVVYVASSFAGGLRTDDLLRQRRWFNGARAYAQSKQAGRMLAWAWHRRLAPDGVTVNAAHPRGTATNIAGHQRGSGACWPAPPSPACGPGPGSGHPAVVGGLDAAGRSLRDVLPQTPGAALRLRRPGRRREQLNPFL